MGLRTNLTSAWSQFRDAGKPIAPATPALYRAGGRGGRVGALNSGGLVNTGTGMGTSLDKSQGGNFTPTRIYWRGPLEVLCVESWVARNAIDIPNDDMFIRTREHEGDDQQAVKAMMDACETLQVDRALNRAMKNADQYGTGIVVMSTAEDDWEQPLDVKRIREGDLKALHWFDRYDISVQGPGDTDWLSPHFGDPILYNIHPSNSATPRRVHRSRVLRFDGIPVNTRSGYTMYSQWFGVSVLVPIMVAIMEDQTLAQCIAHASQEFSIPVLHIAGLREAIAGSGDPNEASPEVIGQQINMAKSIYRILMLDEEGRESFTRVAVNFGGLADLMEKYQGRVAAARKIPQTRFLGRAPAGMNATGESDMKNYVLMMEADRATMLHPILKQLDMVIARHVGIRNDPPDYEFPTLMELSDTEIAEAAKMKAEALDIAVKGYWMSEDEARDAINGDPAFGKLEGPPPDAPDPIEMIEKEAKAKASAMPPGTNGANKQPVPSNNGKK